jgi:hypothetical protein
MESDTVRAMGDSTLVDLWIEGKFRAITVSRQAIESFIGLPTDGGSSLTEGDRCEFVRTHLGVIVNAAAAQLRSDPAADAIVIGEGQLGGDPIARVGERRTGDRRKGERRQRNIGPPRGVERRRG